MSEIQALTPEGTQHLMQKVKTEKEDVFRLSTMPTASADNVGQVIQFIGTTSGGYTHGYFYECKENSGSYSWQQTDVQPNGGGSGLPSGGTTGQVLKKKSNTDYDVEWGEGGSGGEGSIIIINDTYSLYEDETVTVSKGTYSKSAVIDNGSATIKGFTETGTVTVSVSDFTKTFNIDKYSKYEVGVGDDPYVYFDYTSWLLSVGESASGYSSLADVLADEEMVRELFTRHASVDYLVSVSESSDIATIINNDYCAKWINLRDYALDTLYADSNIAALMDEADKYFYGEWTIIDSTTTPPTWGAKGNVPIMTSNTAPYGTASAYQVFDGNPSTTANGTDFSYQATNPICVRDFICKNTSNIDITGGTLQLQGSNDGGTWISISSPSENNSYYLYHRVHFANSHTVAIVQFYGRELKVSQNSQPTDGRTYVYVNSKYYTEEWGEYDWDTDNPRHYIYDHGVELEDLIFDGDISYKLLAENDGNNIHLKSSGGNSSVISSYVKAKGLILSSYNVLRLITGNILSTNNANGRYLEEVIYNHDSTSPTIAYISVKQNMTPNNINMDVSSVNGTGTYDLWLSDSNNGGAESTYTEWWLE